MARKRYLVLIGIIILAVLLSQFDLQKIARILANADIGILISALLLVFLTVAIKTVKWQQALAFAGIRIPFFRALKLYLIGFFLGVATPGRIGDFSKALYLKKLAPLSRGLATVLVDRLFDIGALVITGFAGLVLFSVFFNSALAPIEIGIIAVLALIGGVLFFFRLDGFSPFLKPLVLMLVPENHKTSVSAHMREFHAQAMALLKNPRLLATATVLSIAAVVLSIATGFLLGKSIGIDIPWHFLAALIPVAALADMLPISVLGLGTREVIVVYAFSVLAIPAETALSFSFLLLLVGYVSIALTGLFLFLTETVSPADAVETWAKKRT